MRVWIGVLAGLIGCVEGDEKRAPDSGTESLGDPVDDIDDVDGDGGGDELEDPAFLYTGEVLEFGLTFDDAALEALAAASPEVDMEDVHATFTWGDESYDVGVHLRGGTGTFEPMTGKPSFKIDFHQWDEEQEFHGARRMTLVNMVQDPSMLAERAAYALYAAMGVPTPRFGYARVTVNGEPFGLYGVTETLDERFVKRTWDDNDGPLYEGGADLYAGQEDNYGFAEKPDEDTDRAELFALVAALDASTPENWLATLEDRFHADALFDLWAVELLTGNADGYVTQHNNYYLYWEPSADKWSMVPWGPDLAFAAQLDVAGLYAARLYQGCFASPACMERLHARMGMALDAWEAMDLQSWLVAEAERTQADCEADPRAPWGAEGCQLGREALLNFVAARPAEARARLGIE